MAFDPNIEIEHICSFIKEYFYNNGQNAKAIIGMSGGKDSNIAAALLVRALGANRVVGYLMPNGGNQDPLAEEVCRGLDMRYHTIDITPIVNNTYTAISSVFTLGEHKHPKITSNVPARVRMNILYSMAALEHGRVIHTGNASEMYVGYTTKYGDLAGDVSIFRHYTVSEIYKIGDALNLPEHWVHKEPADGMTGLTDEQSMGLKYTDIDNMILNNRKPNNYWDYVNLMNRRNQNKHKEAVNLPAPYPATRKIDYYTGDGKFRF